MMKTRTNADWLQELAVHGEQQEAAIADLRLYLLRAALYTIHRYRGERTQLAAAEIERLAEDCAQDALLAILKRLPEFRGDSRFTTWAYKFGVNIALVAARREGWKRVSLDSLLADSDLSEWPFAEVTPVGDPARAALQGEVWSVILDVIEHQLTEHQRLVLKAMVFDGVPMDEMARHLGSNRNALYKLLHDARRKLRAHLEARGFQVQEILDLFSAKT
ncbi:MAG TPA: sigma-70 family RNA polymerase sigma factor [Anaerolineae bacterium]|nr:sigma-70 family RNA polymerase sigma factor [Anaerolineae bacterium]